MYESCLFRSVRVVKVTVFYEICAVDSCNSVIVVACCLKIYARVSNLGSLLNFFFENLDTKTIKGNEL